MVAVGGEMCLANRLKAEEGGRNLFGEVRLPVNRWGLLEWGLTAIPHGSPFERKARHPFAGHLGLHVHMLPVDARRRVLGCRSTGRRRLPCGQSAALRGTEQGTEMVEHVEKGQAAAAVLEERVELQPQIEGKHPRAEGALLPRHRGRKRELGQRELLAMARELARQLEHLLKKVSE